MPPIDPAWLALIGTLCGGIGLKLAEAWLNKGKVKTDYAANIRDELRVEVAANREEIKDLETDVDKWKGNYYDLRDKYVELQTQLTLALNKIQQEATDAQNMQHQIDKQPPPTLE